MEKVRKIVVIGPESTGKSTLSEDLAAALGTVWVREYAREYLEQLERPYREEDLLAIAKGQVAQEEAAMQHAKKWLVCDTDLYVVKVWSEHKYQRADPWILETIASRAYDLYLLTDIDMAWQPDPQREYPEESMRHYFFNIYKDIVQNSGTPFFIISGTPQERLEQALAAVRSPGFL